MLNFLKNAIVRGLVVLIPLVLVYLTLRELFEAMVALATPIADLMPTGWFRKDDPEKLIALVLILLTALILGLIWSAGPTRRAAEWLESRSQVDLVPVTLDEYSLALTHFGLGLSEALQKRDPGQ